MERTLLILKPDAVRRGLMGEIIGRFEKKGLKIVGMKLTKIPVATAHQHYAEHNGKPFFNDLVAFMTGGPVVIMAVEGEKAISVARLMMGATKFFESAPGTIRGDYAFSITENLIHGSDSAASAERELKLFFKPEEIVA